MSTPNPFLLSRQDLLAEQAEYLEAVGFSLSTVELPLDDLVKGADVEPETRMVFRLSDITPDILPRGVELVTLSGQARVGKDTVAKYLASEYDFDVMSFAHALKAAVCAMLGWNERHMDGDLKTIPDPFWGVTPAEMFQFVGTEVGREALAKQFPWAFGEQDIWLRRVVRDMAEVTPGTRILMTDGRFPNELNLTHTLGGLVVGIERPFEMREASGRSRIHKSETALSDYGAYDAVIDNSFETVEPLYEAIDETMRGLGIERRQPTIFSPSKGERVIMEQLQFQPRVDQEEEMDILEKKLLGKKIINRAA